MNQFLKGCNLYLIGMMGSGKTTIAQILAPQLEYRYFDTDRLIEQVAGQSIPEIFAESGEAAFRELETKVLSELCAYTRLVVATGGGIILNRQNWSYLQHGVVVWLDVPVEQLYQRLEGDTTRPLLRDPDPMGKLRSLLDQRQSLYSQADVRVIVGPEDTPEQIATGVLSEISKILKHRVNQN
ncbi:shikimate kinase [Laspinema palackyanum]|uniref:shikimate kinase n=1 Tax=Laspinema palackyanum TaxID=3231601 RepID=UPI00345CD897|nr:shikimate kinase [Laspinema sp. D2c]